MTNLIHKYAREIVADKIPFDEQIEYASILEITVDILTNNENFNKRSVDEKVCSIYVVKSLYLKNPEFKMEDVTNTISEFLLYYDQEYDNYKNQFAQITDLFYNKIMFIDIFVNRKLPKV